MIKDAFCIILQDWRMNSGCLFQRRHPYSRNGAIIRKASAFSQLASILYFLCSWRQRGRRTRRGEGGKGIWKYLVTEEIILFITFAVNQQRAAPQQCEHISSCVFGEHVGSAETPPPPPHGRCYRSIWSPTSRLTHCLLPTAVPLLNADSYSPPTQTFLPPYMNSWTLWLPSKQSLDKLQCTPPYCTE